jgi:hypothetical protein
VYVAGRTMFETEKLPEGLVEYANAVDEVLVPTRCANQGQGVTRACVPLRKFRILGPVPDHTLTTHGPSGGFAQVLSCRNPTSAAGSTC